MATEELGEEGFEPVGLQDPQSNPIADRRTDDGLRRQYEEIKARLAAIVESSTDAIVSKTLDGVIQSWNAAAERLFGYTADEAVGKSITLIVPPERLDEEHTILDRLHRGERIESLDTVRLAKDGHRLDISVTISPIRDDAGRIIGASKIARDVSERKRVENAVREQGHMMRHVAEAALTIHSSGSVHSVLRVVAKEAKRILGALHAVSILTVLDNRAAADGKCPFSEVQSPWREHGIPSVLDPFCAEVCRTNRPLRLTRAEMESHPAWRKSNGDEHQRAPQRSWLAAPFVSREGKNLGLVQAADKIDGEFSENDEAALVQLGHLGSVAIENARLYSELSDQDRRKDEFIALLAHELRNPLAPLRNGLEVIRLADGDEAAVGEARAMMERQLGHMVRLIDDLLDISRINQNKLELRRTHVLLDDVIRSAVEIARPAITAAGHELSLLLPSGPVHLFSDFTRLAQVLSNLLTNSAKYTRRGGHIWLTAQSQGPWVTIVVRDNGIGIPAEALSKIFNMFSQVDRGADRAAGGLGIGLSLVKGLVEMHGGTVEATSAGPGKGSTFTVRLRSEQDVADVSAEGSADESAREFLAKRRILVVDDNRDAALSLAMVFRLEGHEVRFAYDGAEAVEVAEEFRPQVILMDMGMPRLNGYEATRRIREQPWGKSVRIIALTGWGQAGDKARSLAAGCNGHLVKPVNMHELETLLKDPSPA